MGKSNEDYTGAFVFGAVLAGLGAAAAVIWRAPQSGSRTRAQIVEHVESTLFRALKMDAHQAAAPATSAEPLAGNAWNPPVAGVPIDAVETAPPDLGEISGLRSTDGAPGAETFLDVESAVDGPGTYDASISDGNIGLNDTREHRP